VTPPKVVKAFYAILGSENSLAVLDLIADSIQWTEVFPGYGGTWVGADAIRKHVFEPLNRDWTDFLAAAESFVVEDRIVVTFGTYSGVYNKTGESITASFVHRWEVVDGELTSLRQYTDTALIQAALM
jgi:ketosteroid isomerase-like protein